MSSKDFVAITPEGNMTSYYFYNTVLKKMHDYILQEDPPQLLLDFSATKGIDALVLPNLLCLGYWVLKYSGRPVKIFVPSSPEFVSIRTFLANAGFADLAQKFGLFDFEADVTGGLSSRVYKSSLNTTQVFQSVYKTDDAVDVEKTKIAIWNQLNSSLVPFIHQFLLYSDDKSISRNLEQISETIVVFCRELVENALLHGWSFCFLTMQYTSNYRKQIKISVSDCGCGFLNSIERDRKRSKQILCMKSNGIPGVERLMHECPPLQSDSEIRRYASMPVICTELEGIVYGLLSRFNKPYGLYNVYQIVSKMGGTIRIHSNDTQLVLSERLQSLLTYCHSPEKLLQILENKQEYTANVRRGLKFKGTHIELEIMLEKAEEENL